MEKNHEKTFQTHRYQTPESCRTFLRNIGHQCALSIEITLMELAGEKEGLYVDRILHTMRDTIENWYGHFFQRQTAIPQQQIHRITLTPELVLAMRADIAKELDRTIQSPEALPMSEETQQAISHQLFCLRALAFDADFFMENACGNEPPPN